LKSKKILVTLMLSASILGTMNGSMVTTFAAENTTATSTNQTNQIVNIPDANLKSELNFRLGHAANAPITADELATIKKLNIRNKNIASIEGLQYCVNLQTLILGNNALMGEEESNTISDLSPLKNLKKLTSLVFGGLKITDFSPLKNLPLKVDPTQLGIWVNENFGGLKVTLQSDGTVVWKNPFVDVNGEAMMPENLCGGTYNKTDNTITWSKEEFKKHVTFSEAGTDYLSLNISLEQANITFNLAIELKVNFDEVTPIPAVEQTIKLGGQGCGNAIASGAPRVSLTVKDHKASIVKNSNYQFHWGGWKTSKYASIKLTDPNGQVLYNQAWNGNQQVQGHYGTLASFDLPENSMVEIYHAEGPWHRFSTSDNDNLKTKLGKKGYTYTYKVQNNQLVLMNVQ